MDKIFIKNIKILKVYKNIEKLKINIKNIIIIITKPKKSLH